MLDGNSYYDAPEEEYPVPRESRSGIPADSGEGRRVFPCHVYDAEGALLRVEYPKTKQGDLRWQRGGWH